MWICRGCKHLRVLHILSPLRTTPCKCKHGGCGCTSYEGIFNGPLMNDQNV